jgi:hypothetical protein
MSKQNKTLAIVAGVLLALWLGLFLSGRGFLVWGDKPDGDRKLGMMKCNYFTGTGVVERQYLYSEEGFLGKQACPRWITLK